MTETPEGHEPTTPLPPVPPTTPSSPPAPPTYKPGDVANGHILTTEGTWVPVGAGAPAPAPAYGQPGFNPAAPYGVHPVTGAPYSEKQKLVAGLLQILIPLGIGRFYMGQTGLGVAQLLVTLFTCGIGGIWPFIDGIVILAGDPKDAQGRPLRP